MKLRKAVCPALQHSHVLDKINFGSNIPYNAGLLLKGFAQAHETAKICLNTLAAVLRLIIIVECREQYQLAPVTSEREMCNRGDFFYNE